MKIWHEVWDYVKMIIIVVVVVLVINNVVLINAKIPSESMENTIMTGDRIFGFRLAYGFNMNVFGNEISKKWKDPERFDIVIFKYPETPLEDSYVPETPLGSFGPYEVPENCYFMMGDNRNNSKDSRYWTNTFVRFDQIVGKVLLPSVPLGAPVEDDTNASAMGIYFLTHLKSSLTSGRARS